MEKHEDQGTGASGPIQGEGDYRAAREYREEVREYLERADIEKAARDAAPRDREEALELEQAEDIGRSRAKVGPRRTQAAARSLRHAVRDRPLTAMVIAGTLGCFLGWAGHRSGPVTRRARASRGR